MRKLIGMVVSLEGKFYIYTPGVELGSFKLIPIIADLSRNDITVTPEIEKQIVLWGREKDPFPIH